LTDGRVINARHVIVTAGPQTVLNGFDKDAWSSKSKVIDVEYYVLHDKTGLPACFMELHEDGEFYGLWEGDKIHQYKVGYHEERKIGKTLDYFK